MAPRSYTRKAVPKKRSTLPMVVPQSVSMRHVRPVLKIGSAVLSVVALVTLTIVFDVPRRIVETTESISAQAGFEVDDINVVGARYMPKIEINKAVATAGGSMLFTDVKAIQAEVERIPWVAKATVMRKLPHTIAVEITEREPFALWQHNQKLTVIDKAGVLLTSTQLERFAHLPMVVGEGAPLHVADVFTDLEQVPALKADIDTVTWIGSRRWDVRFKSGDVLMLPEGRRETQAALVAFAQLNSANHLLKKGLGSFDMRMADKLFVKKNDPSHSTHYLPAAAVGAQTAI